MIDNILDTRKTNFGYNLDSGLDLLDTNEFEELFDSFILQIFIEPYYMPGAMLPKVDTKMSRT